MCTAVHPSFEAIQSHSLFQDTDGFHRIGSPAEIGYHPDSVLTSFDHFALLPKNMPANAIRGDHFVAVKCAPVNDLTQTKVECVFLRYIEGKWVLHKFSQPVSEDQFSTFKRLIKGEEVQMGDQLWKRV
jgi:hypothetical protein